MLAFIRLLRRFSVMTTCALALVAMLAALGSASCGSETPSDSPGGDLEAGDGDDDGGGGTLGFDGSLAFDGGVQPVHSNYGCDGCAPFPPDDAGACPPATLGSATIAYPPTDVVFPPNLNVLEVQFTKPAGATLFEVDFENAVTDVRVETPCVDVANVRGGPSLGCGVTLPAQAWTDIANVNRGGATVNVTVRATANGACVSTSTTTIGINFTKEDLAGGIYYWQSAVYGGAPGRTGGIYSHDFGTFDPTPTPFYESGKAGTCVGCHSLSRDGERISLGIDDPDADDEFLDVRTQTMAVKTRSVLATGGYGFGGGSGLGPGFQTWAHDHSRLIATSWSYQSGGNTTLKFFDGDGLTLLASPALGVAGTQPDLSADDKQLVFVVPQSGTISPQGDHHFMGGSLYTASVDLGTNTVGAPSALLTAAAGETFFYPSFSPDGRFVIFNHAASGDAFYNRNARVQLLHFPPKAGDKAIDLPALNVADGLTNSWPRWSPFVQSYQGRKLLWVTFSSNRDYGLHLVNKGFDNCYPPASPAYDQPQTSFGGGFDKCAQPQIWMAAVLVDPQGEFDVADRSFPAFWLPFQDVNSHNHSAQWVEKVLNPSSPDAGACAASGATCASQPCCSDSVCCQGVCQVTCVK